VCIYLEQNLEKRHQFKFESHKDHAKRRESLERERFCDHHIIWLTFRQLLYKGTWFDWFVMILFGSGGSLYSSYSQVLIGMLWIVCGSGKLKVLGIFHLKRYQRIFQERGY